MKPYPTGTFAWRTPLRAARHLSLGALLYVLASACGESVAEAPCKLGCPVPPPLPPQQSSLRVQLKD